MRATEIKNAVFAAIAAAGSAVAQALGGWDTALAVLVALMAIDYITGLLLALVWHRSAKSESGAFASAASIKGLLRKGVMLVIVWIGAMLDSVTGAAYVRTAVVLFFIANEGLSILENTAVMGVPYPKFLRAALEAMREKNDAAEES